MPENNNGKIAEIKKPENLSAQGTIKSINEQDIVIHTMPKRFLLSKPSVNKAKGIGLLILVGGAIVLIVGGAFLYIYITGTGSLISDNRNNSSLNNDSNMDELQSTTTVNKKIENTEASSTTENNLASSTMPSGDLSASNTDPDIINETVNATSSGTTAEIDSATGTKVIKFSNSASSTAEFVYPADGDADGLFDTEETLFDANISAKDSDGDTFSDLSEILGLYNPAGKGGLIVNSNIEKYINAKYGFSVYYPYLWQTEKINGDESMIFKLGNNQFIQIIVDPNSDKKTLSDWYKENTGETIINNEQILYKKGWEAVKSKNGLVVYLTKSILNNIIIMSYSLGTSNILNYKNVFDMMVNSLETNQ